MSTFLPKVNAYGLAKATKFRQRFGLTTDNIDRDYIDSHDYLHTVLGRMPVYEDEYAVLELEEKVRAGLQLRGLVAAPR